ncbi:MAG: polyphenol oxidase family protein [Acidimicrobiales bacterium]
MPHLDLTIDLGSRRARIVSTARADGDFGLERVTDDDRRRFHPAPWTWLRQVHGADVVTVVAAGAGAGSAADAAVTDVVDAPVAVLTADCAPVVLVGDRAVAAVHAGWRGLVAGVIEAAAARLVALDARPVTTILGPCISPASYEFGATDLAVVAARYGPTVGAVSDRGTPALDLPAAVAAACVAAGWPAPERPACTSAPGFFSHRTRGDRERQTTLAWLELAP